ncbi:MAG TPA: hypothetical protein VIV11_26675 [Kofleriaceae bacterium]
MGTLDTLWCARAMVLVACLGCGRLEFDELDEPDDVDVMVPSWGGGTRLRPRVYVFPDGQRSLEGWYDSELATPCFLDALDADGVRRCFPRAMDLVFTDAACTLPVGLTTDTLPATAWAGKKEVIGCDFRWTRWYPALAPVAAPQQIYVLGSTGCAGPTAPMASHVFYTLGPAAAPTGLVSVSDTVRGTRRLRAEGWQADDGAFSLATLHDAALGTQCQVAESADGLRCLPAGSAGVSVYFSDPACTRSLAITGGGCFAPRYVWGYERCSAQRIYELGAPHSGAIYAQNGAVCELTSSTAALAAIGPEVDASTFVLGASREEPTAGRLVPVHWHGSDGGQVLLNWLDTARDSESCVLGTGFGSGAHCTPSEALVSIADYADASCVVPIAENEPACQARYIYVSDSRGVSVHEIDTTASAPTTRFQYFGSCMPATLDTSKSYESGGVVLSFSDFEAAVEVIE